MKSALIVFGAACAGAGFLVGRVASNHTGGHGEAAGVADQIPDLQTTQHSDIVVVAEHGDPQGDRAPDLATLCLKQSDSDPARAVATAQLLKLDADRRLMDELFDKWIAKDEVEALNWAIGLPEGPEREVYIRKGALVLASTDPSQAAELLLREVTPDAAQEAAVVDIVNKWNRTDWNAAMAWAEQIPAENPMRPRVLAMVKASVRPSAR